MRPQTVLRWHRAGWRLFWRFKSRHRSGRPPIDHTLRDLIVAMALENPTWGAPRIHGELLKLGYSLAESTVSKHLPKRPRNRSPNSPDWHTFLRLHLQGSVGIDFFDIPTATFQLLYGFVVLDHERRKILHLGVTDHPTAEWVTNQLRLAFENTDGPKRLFLDKDSPEGRPVQPIVNGDKVVAIPVLGGLHRYERRAA